MIIIKVIMALLKVFIHHRVGSIYNFWLKNYNIKNIKKTISFYIKTFKAPFICKNLNLSFKIKLIKKLFLNQSLSM